jgi:phosphoglycolate phosphatase
VQGLLFDLDGVLADSRGPITACVNRALLATGHAARPTEDLLGFIGPPATVGFAELTGAAPDSEAVAACVTAYRAAYADALHETRTYPGVPEAVEALARDLRLGVATSKPLRYARPVLEAIGLAGAFAVVCGPDADAHADKTATVGEALQRLGGAVAMVGDRRFDMVAARAHGLRAIGAGWGFGSRAELEQAGADVIVDAPAHLTLSVVTGHPPAAPSSPPGRGVERLSPPV